MNIGVLTDMSGLYKDFSGQGSVEAARMAVEDFGGQVLNATIQVYAGDHKNDVPTATGIATEWFDNKRVGMVVDIPHSPAAIAMRKLASECRRIDIAVSAASTELTGSACTETGFHWAYDTYSNSIPLVRAMVGFRLKQPAQSRQPWDYYEILSTIPRNKAFRPLEESVCPLVKS